MLPDDVSFDASDGNTEKVLLALYNGLAVDARDRMGRTLLHYAVIERRHALIQALIRYRATVNIQDREGWSPLHFAAQNSDDTGAAILLGAGAALDVPDEHGNTPLSTAVFAARGKGDLIRRLLAAGADPRRCNNHGVSPLRLAQTIANYDNLSCFRGFVSDSELTRGSSPPLTP